MHLAKRAALAAAILSVSFGLTACKKKEKEGEKKDPVVEPDKGSGSASGSGSAAKTDEMKPADAALKGFKGAMAEASGGKVGGIMDKAKGGLGAQLGSLFGGGAAAAAEGTAQDTDRHAMGKGQDPSAAGEAQEEGDEGDDVKGDPGAAPAAIKFPPAGQPGGDCAAVTDRLMVVITAMMGAEMGAVDDAQQTEMRTMISTMCTEQNWSQELKDCALAAMSEADLDACEKYAPADMGKGDEPVGDDGELEAGEDYPAEPAKPVAAWTGGDSCKDVGDRLIQLSIAQMGELPPEALAEMESSLAEAADQVKQMCEEMKWSDSVRKCILAAPTIDDTGSCMSELTGDM